MNAGKVIDVAAGMVFHRGNLLITQRRAGDHLGGLWEFPGGKVEAGESFEECLKRELREELGIEVSVGKEVHDLTHSYPEKTVRLKFFFCVLLDGEALPLHCDAIAWVTRNELKNYNFPAADSNLIQALQDGELWNGGD